MGSGSSKKKASQANSNPAPVVQPPQQPQPQQQPVVVEGSADQASANHSGSTPRAVESVVAQEDPQQPENVEQQSNEMGLAKEREQQLKELGQLPSIANQRTGLFFIDTYPDVEWRETFQLGVDFVDSQHKVLVELLQNLNVQIREYAMCNADRIGLENVLRDLKHYSEFHFREEEVMMEEYQWPGVDDHKKVHAEFIAKIAEYQQKFADDDVAIGHDVLDYLKDWLITHIMYTDRKVCDFINEKKREREALQQASASKPSDETTDAPKEME